MFRIRLLVLILFLLAGTAWGQEVPEIPEVPELSEPVIPVYVVPEGSTDVVSSSAVYVEPDFPVCPVGYTLVSQLEGALRADRPAQRSKTYTFFLQSDAHLWIGGWSKEGHPEKGCSPYGGSAEPAICNQHQDDESYHVYLDDQYIGSYYDSWFEENAWFSAGPWTMLATAGEHDLIIRHVTDIGVNSVDYMLSVCTRRHEPTDAWLLSGNSDVPPSSYLGTADRRPLRLLVEGMAGIRIYPSPEYYTPTIVAGYGWAEPDLYGAVIAGGGILDSENRVFDNFSVVSGGLGNHAGIDDGGPYSGFASTVSGGRDNRATATYATVGGGHDNRVTDTSGTIAGGAANTASGIVSTISGGQNNRATGDYSTVGGGLDNNAEDYYTTISGGQNNRASDNYSTVGGGLDNWAIENFATVSGGGNNTAAEWYSTIGGGYNNIAGGSYTVIAGGDSNVANAVLATIAGGQGNLVYAPRAFAYGSYVSIPNDHTGAMLFSDATDATFASQAANEFAVRATGGVRLVTGVDSSGTPTSGVQLPAGGGAWLTMSDRNAKINFTDVDAQDVLQALADIPITTWNYTTQDEAIRHIGPMAQDFYAAFGVGEGETTISTVDADGVTMAAIQGLYEMVQEKDAQIAGMESRFAVMLAVGVVASGFFSMLVSMLVLRRRQ